MKTGCNSKESCGLDRNEMLIRNYWKKTSDVRHDLTFGKLLIRDNYTEAIKKEKMNADFR